MQQDTVTHESGNIAWCQFLWQALTLTAPGLKLHRCAAAYSCRYYLQCIPRGLMRQYRQREVLRKPH